MIMHAGVLTVFWHEVPQSHAHRVIALGLLLHKLVEIILAGSARPILKQHQQQYPHVNAGRSCRCGLVSSRLSEQS